MLCEAVPTMERSTLPRFSGVGRSNRQPATTPALWPEEDAETPDLTAAQVCDDSVERARCVAGSSNAPPRPDVLSDHHRGSSPFSGPSWRNSKRFARVPTGQHRTGCCRWPWRQSSGWRGWRCFAPARSRWAATHGSYASHFAGRMRAQQSIRGPLANPSLSEHRLEAVRPGKQGRLLGCHLRKGPSNDG